MARATRYDTHRMDAVEVTPSGALRVPARLARVGVLTYDDGAGNTWGELVPAETLFAADSLATMRGVALTDLHPGALVTPATYRTLAVGHVGDDVKRDGAYLAAPVYVTDADAIRLVQAGERRDVSCGYTCDFDETPGVLDGVPYARVQRNRVYNHLGLGPEGWGRAGTDVSLRLDGASEAARFDAPVARLDSQTTGGGSTAPANPAASATGANMANAKRRDGDEPAPDDKDKKTEPPKADEAPEMIAKKDADEAMANMEAKHIKMISTLEEMVAEMAKQLAVLKAGESAEVTEADVPEAVADSIVAKRLARLDSAREAARLVAPAVKLDGLLKVRDIHAATVAAVLPAVKLDGVSDDALAGMVTAFVEAARAKTAKRADGAAKVSAVLTPSTEQAEEVAREDGQNIRDARAEQAREVSTWSQWGARAPKGDSK